MKLFLSYGHDKNSRIVTRIRDDLIRDGHQVWIDIDRLRVGSNWRRDITNGILESDVFFSFASEHSIRNPGVCLDELSIAVSVKGAQIQSIILESNITPPSNVSYRQYIDMSSWEQHISTGDFENWYHEKYHEIVAVINHPETQKYAEEINYLRSRLKPNLSANKKESLEYSMYSGREWLTEKVDKWKRNGGKVLLITGSPGIGKSAFMTHSFLDNESVGALIYCEWDNLALNNMDSISRTLVFQLSTKLSDYRSQVILLLQGEEDSPSNNNLNNTGKDIFRWLLINPLKQLIDGNRPVTLILIDGLDEIEELSSSLNRKTNPLAEIIGNHLNEFPSWIKFLLTSRPDVEVSLPLHKADVIDIDSYDTCIKNDIKKYLTQRLANVFKNFDVTLIGEKCNGNFLYAKLLCDNIIQNSITIEEITDLSPDMDSFYLRNFDRTFQSISDFDENYYPALCMLSVSSLPIPMSTIKRGMKWTQRQYNKFLKLMAHYIKSTNSGLRFFHKSLLDWITSDVADTYEIDHELGIFRLALACLESYQNNKKEMNAYEYRNLIPFIKQCSQLINQTNDILSDIEFGHILLKRAASNKNNFEYNEASELIQYSIDIFTNCSKLGFKDSYELLGNAYNQAAEIADLSVNLEYCISICETGINTLLDLNINCDAKIKEQLAKLFFQKGLSERRRNYWTKADVCYTQAYQYFIEIENVEKAIEVLNAKALTYRVCGKVDDALACYNQIMGFKNYSNLKKDNPSLYILIKMSFAWCLHGQGKYSLAEPMLNECEQMYNNNPSLLQEKDIAQLYYIMALEYYGTAEYEKSLTYSEKSLAHVKVAYGSKAVEICSALNQIGNSLVKMEKYRDAISFFQCSVDIRLKFYGKENIYTVISMRNLARAYMKLESDSDIDYAKELLADIHRIKEKLFQNEKNKSVVGQSWLDIGELYEIKGDYVRALQYYKNAEDIYSKYNVSLDMGICFFLIGRIFYKLGQYNESEKHLTLAKDKYLIGVVSKHSIIKEIEQLLSTIEQAGNTQQPNVGS